MRWFSHGLPRVGRQIQTASRRLETQATTHETWELAVYSPPPGQGKQAAVWSLWCHVPDRTRRMMCAAVCPLHHCANYACCCLGLICAAMASASFPRTWWRSFGGLGGRCGCLELTILSRRGLITHPPGMEAQSSASPLPGYTGPWPGSIVWVSRSRVSCLSCCLK
jgi:hypothetical protein